MSNQPKKEREGNITDKQPSPRKNQTIVLPFNQESYMDIIKKPKKFKMEMDKFITDFPDGIENGYHCKEIPCFLV